MLDAGLVPGSPRLTVQHDVPSETLTHLESKAREAVK